MAVSLLTAFYMIRLMVLAFAGTYRGPAWTRQASPASAAEAAAHGARHPLDAHAHGEAERDDHEVTHGAADALASTRHWDGPHEALMRAPVLLLALGTLLVGFLGVPAALGGTNAIERFLTPSLAVPIAASALDPAGAAEAVDVSHPHSRGLEISLMLFSLGVATAGILAARRVYLVRPGSAWQIAQRWPRTHALLSNAFYLDEIDRAAAVRGTWAMARSLLVFDCRVVDGLVDGAGVVTRISAWISHMLDKHLVDGLVRGVAAAATFGGAMLRRSQTGLLQHYALAMVAGVFVLLTTYLMLTSAILDVD